jgi:integrase
MSDPVVADGLIVNTDQTCKIHGRSWEGIPTLVWPEGIDEVASDWFRDIVLRYGASRSTAHEYANVLRPFLRFCRQRKRTWQSVNDEFLILWREQLNQTAGVSKARVNHVLKTIFAFYTWAEYHKYVRYRVGVYVANELPEALADYVFPISAKRVYRKSRSGRVFANWTTPLTLTDAEKGRMRHTPNEDEIRKLHEAAAEHRHAERDSLMLSFEEETGARRSDVLQIGKSHLPEGDQLAQMIERDEPWVVMIVRKGGGLKPLNLLPDLIIRTLNFIEFERSAIVSQCLEKIVGYSEPDQIFLSSTTGRPLHLDSVSSIGRKIFARAGVKNASMHRLRARFAVRVVEELVDAVFGDAQVGPQSNAAETILTKAAEMMGHAHPESLRPYLTYVLNRRIQTAESTKAGKLSARIRQLKLDADAFVRRLSTNKELHGIALELAAGRRADAVKALRRLADNIEVNGIA